jgi:peptidoglycan hydrolase-like protein with peptidoglycan-binding domain
MRLVQVFVGAAALALSAYAAEPNQTAAAKDAKVVTSVQAKLGIVPADGELNPQTEAAIREFQRAKGLQPTGQLDPKTLTALGMGEPKPKPAAAGGSAQGEGKPSTPIGPHQSSAERAAEPTIKPDAPTGVQK